jgi:hypothetical protein
MPYGWLIQNIGGVDVEGMVRLMSLVLVAGSLAYAQQTPNPRINTGLNHPLDGVVMGLL